MKNCGILWRHSVNVSSNWNNATNAGTFNFNANNAESNVNQNIGSRLTNFVKCQFASIYPATWQNRKMNKHCAGRA